MSNEFVNDFEEFEQLEELASTKKGGRIVFSTDDFFAPAEGLLRDEEPIRQNKHTEFGEWMDGWETRRKRIAGHDWSIIALKEPAVIKEICVDTAFFTGNFAPRFSIQAARLDEKVAKKFPRRKGELGSAASEEDMEKMAELKTDEWTTIVKMSPLRAGYSDTRKSYFTVKLNMTWTHLRLNIYPDGGIARLRVFGVTSKERKDDKPGDLIDLIASKNGGRLLSCSNFEYGSPENMIKSDDATAMKDTWETARNPNRPPIIRTADDGTLLMPGEEWAIFQLGRVGVVKNITIDTAYHKGNVPLTTRIDGIWVTEDNPVDHNSTWINVLPTKIMKPDAIHFYGMEEIQNVGSFTHIKITIKPDGGLSRVRIWGYSVESFN